MNRPAWKLFSYVDFWGILFAISTRLSNTDKKIISITIKNILPFQQKISLVKKRIRKLEKLIRCARTVPWIFKFIIGKVYGYNDDIPPEAKKTLAIFMFRDVVNLNFKLTYHQCNIKIRQRLFASVDSLLLVGINVMAAQIHHPYNANCKKGLCLR
jgi:hypothetical protein